APPDVAAAGEPVVPVPRVPSGARPAAPSGGAIRPAAVLQPSAVLMPGAPRPAAVLPPTAFAPSPYGIPAQPAAPVVPPVAPPVVEPPVAAPVSSDRSSEP